MIILSDELKDKIGKRFGAFELKETNDCVLITESIEHGFAYLDAYIFKDGNLDNKTFKNVEYVDPISYIEFDKPTSLYRFLG